MEGGDAVGTHRPVVLLIGPGLGGGGSERRFRLLAEHLFGGRSDTVALSADRVPTSLRDASDRIVEAYGCRNEFDYPKSIVRLRAMIRKVRYDVIYCHGVFANLVAWAATRGVAARHRPRLIMSEVSRPELLARLWRRPQDRMVQQLRRLAYPSATILAANSIDGMEDCVRSYRIQRSRIVRIPNLIDLADLEAKALDEPSYRPLLPESPTIVVSSRLDRHKCVDTVIKSFAQLDGSTTAQLLILGTGPAEPSLRDLADDLGLGSRIQFLGWQKNPFPLLRRAIGFVHASELEGFSNSILEAMFLNVPVITSRHSSDVADMCEKGAALGFDIGDVPALTTCLDTLLHSSEARTRLTTAARAYCRPHELQTSLPVYERLMVRAAENDHG